MSPVAAQGQVVNQCLSCGSDHLEGVLDLGVQPLANKLQTEADLEKPESRFPLGLQICCDCRLLQLTHLVPPSDLFSDYFYFSSFSQMMLDHSAKAARHYIDVLDLGTDSFVVEVASNDGYLLRNFVEVEIPCLGIEPAANIAAVAREKGVDTLEIFFGKDSAREVSKLRGKADLILGNNVFAHVPDTNDFVGGLAELLKPDGRVVLEFPYAIDFLENAEFDTVYHEHVFYFSLTALMPLFERHGLKIIDAERIAIHGGSLRLTACHEQGGALCESIEKLLREEEAYGIGRMNCYEEFASRVAGNRQEILAMLGKIKKEGGTLAVYGASAKGSTLLNYCGMGRETFDFAVDRSNYKQGYLTPGTHLPILPPEVLCERQPDYTLLLTWNFADEILEQQEKYRRKGGRFIIPIPEPKII